MIPNAYRSIYVIYKKMFTSLVLLGSTTASQRALAAAQAAELGGKEKALTGFRGLLVTACGIHSVDVWYLENTALCKKMIATSSGGGGIVDGSDLDRVALGHIM